MSHAADLLVTVAPIGADPAFGPAGIARRLKCPVSAC